MDNRGRWLRIASAVLLVSGVLSNITLTWFLYKNYMMLRLIACLVAGEDMLQCLR